MKSRKSRKQTTSRKAKPRMMRQMAYYDPAAPNMLPIPMGRQYGYSRTDDKRLKAALGRFNKLFAADPRCMCMIGVFEVYVP